MKPLFNRYLLLCLAALLIVTAFVGCRQTPGGTDGTEGSDDVTSDVVEKPTAPVTDPDVESEESDTATETSGETDEETDNGDETPGEIIWEPDVLAWYDVDHGSSVNSRPDHGWDPLYQQSPGLVTKGGIFRSATPLLGTYDQIDPVVAKQHLYWLGAAGFDAVVVDITNYNARETGEDFQRYMRGLINNTKVLLQAAKDMTAEGHTNVPQVVIAPRLFGTDFEALEEILEKIHQLQSEYPEQVYRMAGESKPLVPVFCDWAVFDQWGYFDRAIMAVDKLHELLYYPSVRFKIPHWKRVANLIAQNENDLFNEGNENDGHASIMMAIYSLYRKGGVGKDWLIANRDHLKAAADYYLWQEYHPVESNFNGILYSHSETSSQTFGGYDLYSNIISAIALELYARLFDVLEEGDYATDLRRLADKLRRGCAERFLMDHEKYGQVWTDTTDDCWTYEYKRFADLILSSDYLSLDMASADEALFEMMTRTFAAEREVYYSPYSGRQMGYGQGYLTGAVLMLDLVEEYTACVNASANLCYHHTDVPYVVPEGVILHGSGQYWFRNSDLGNAVQQAEIIKEARLMLGVDDFDPAALKIVPRLPATMTAMEAKGLPVITANGVRTVDYRYERSQKLPLWATDGHASYSASFTSDVNVSAVRFGPFVDKDITTNGEITCINKVQDYYYVYIRGDLS